MPVKHALDRSTAFTILLDVDPEFGALESAQGRERVTAFLADWYRCSANDMYSWGKNWARANPVER